MSVYLFSQALPFMTFLDYYTAGCVLNFTLTLLESAAVEHLFGQSSQEGRAVRLDWYGPCNRPTMYAERKFKQRSCTTAPFPGEVTHLTHPALLSALRVFSRAWLCLWLGFNTTYFFVVHRHMARRAATVTPVAIPAGRSAALWRADLEQAPDKHV